MAENTPSLLDLARSRAATRKRSKCTIAGLLLTHPELREEILELLDAAGNPDLSYQVAAEILSERTQTKIAAQGLSRHERGACACEPR